MHYCAFSKFKLIKCDGTSPLFFHQRKPGVLHQPWPLLVPAPHRVPARALHRAASTTQYHLLLWQLQRVWATCMILVFVSLCKPALLLHHNSLKCPLSWTRISIPLPNAALTETTRFRWKQSGIGTGNMWAIDNGMNYQDKKSKVWKKNLHLKLSLESVWSFICHGFLLVYVGPACLRFCSGRGHCSRTGCKWESLIITANKSSLTLSCKAVPYSILAEYIKLWYPYDVLMDFHYFSSSLSNRCDPGFSGPACELASQTFPAFLSEGFSSPRLSSYHSFSSLRGAEVSFGCGVLASGKALVFNRDSRRHLITAPLDSSQARLVWILKASISHRSLYLCLR